MSAAGPCPLCGEQLFGWIALPAAGAEASVGMVLDEQHERIVDRCENCGVALERGLDIDLAAEWEAVCGPDEAGARAIQIPNRASLQAWIGEAGWAGIGIFPGRLILTPGSLALLAGHNGYEIDRPRTPLSRRAQAWMWQTLINGLTFHPNFAREVRAGRLRAATARSRLKFAVDMMVTVLGAPLVLLASAPLEFGGALARRGGELATVAKRR